MAYRMGTLRRLVDKQKPRPRSIHFSPFSERVIVPSMKALCSLVPSRYTMLDWQSVEPTMLYSEYRIVGGTGAEARSPDSNSVREA